MNERQIIINLVTGAYLQDHLGDSHDDLIKALNLIGLDVPEECEGMMGIGKWLAHEHNGTTIWGSSILDD